MDNFKKHLVIGSLYPIPLILFLPILYIFHFNDIFWGIMLAFSELVSVFFVFLTYLIDKNEKQLNSAFLHYLKSNSFGPLFVLCLFLSEYMLYYLFFHISFMNVIIMNLFLISLLSLLLLNPLSNRKYDKIPSTENDPTIVTADLLDVFHNFGISPHLKIIRTDNLKVANAYQSKKHYIYVTSYLASKLTHEELKGVVAHEIAHSVMRDNLKLLFFNWLVLSFGINGLLLPFVLKGYYFMVVASFILLWLFSMILIPMVQRRFEIRADLLACKVVGKEAVISALCKIDSFNLVPNKFSSLWNMNHPSTYIRKKNIVEWNDGSE